VRRGTADDDVFEAEVAVDEARDQLPFRCFQLEGGPTETLRRGRGEPDEEGGRLLLGLHSDIKISSCYRRRVARRAFLLGGSGQTGRALIPKLLDHGWDVVVGSRGEREVPPGAEHVEVDRADAEALRRALGGGADVLVDFVAFEPEHAEQLLSLRDVLGSLVVISSASVYTDHRGRTFDEATTPEQFPDFGGPIRERNQPTVEPAAATYSTKKAAIERTLLADASLPSTLIRAGAIYGIGGPAREWYFVKRIVDGRRYIVLGDHGRSRFHPISTENLAELIWLAAERPGRRVLNAGDPGPPCVLEISRAIAATLDHEWAEVLLSTPSAPCETPWSGPKPVVLDMAEAEFELGYRPVTRYERAVRPLCEWLVAATKDRPWQEVMPRAELYLPNAFDYEAEDAFVRSLTARE
jgi:nucleoside-diphosphate-sugar epimerase